MPEREIDPEAVRIPERSGLPRCLYVPVAARDEAAVERYVGRIARVLESSERRRALLVEAHDPPPRDLRLAMWQLEEASIFHVRQQVWVHVDFRAYRQAYGLALPAESLRGLVLDHVLNRRVARLKGFAFLRIIPISRGANSSSGGLSEGWAVEYHSTPEMRQRNLESRASVQYADLADLVKMLDRKTGGGVMDPVNEAQALVRPPQASRGPKDRMVLSQPSARREVT
jgi:hypothetical protein